MKHGYLMIVFLSFVLEMAAQVGGRPITNPGSA